MDAAKTERGGDVLCVDGFDYVERKDRRGRDGSRAWRCREFRKNKCPATLKTLNGNVVEDLGCNHHSHGGDPFLPKVREIQSLMRAQAASTMDTTRTVVSSYLVNVSQDVLQRLPKRSSLEDNVRAKRRATNPVNPNPQSLNFQMPEKFQDMVLYDSGQEDPLRILILGKQELMDVLERAALWLGDGTFDVCPAVYYQLYTIHCKVGINYPPCVYFLLPDKNQTTYVRALNALKGLIPHANPDTILVDFESAPINAFREVFENSTQKGCLFHQGQNFNKKVDSIGLKKSYETNLEFNIAVKSLLALSFVPENDVLERFLEVVERIDNLVEIYPELERVNELYSYVELNYIRGLERRHGRGRAPAKYPIPLWNHYLDALNNVPRTTNAVEGYHNGLNSLFLASHPTLWKLLAGLRLDMALHLKTLADALMINNPTPRQKYVLQNQRLAAKVDSYAGSVDKLAYLRAVAHIFSG